MTDPNARLQDKGFDAVECPIAPAVAAVLVEWSTANLDALLDDQMAYEMNGSVGISKLQALDVAGATHVRDVWNVERDGHGPQWGHAAEYLHRRVLEAEAAAAAAATPSGASIEEQADEGNASDTSELAEYEDMEEGNEIDVDYLQKQNTARSPASTQAGPLDPFTGTASDTRAAMDPVMMLLGALWDFRMNPRIWDKDATLEWFMKTFGLNAHDVLSVLTANGRGMLFGNRTTNAGSPIVLTGKLKVGELDLTMGLFKPGMTGQEVFAMQQTEAKGLTDDPASWNLCCRSYSYYFKHFHADRSEFLATSYGDVQRQAAVSEGIVFADHMLCFMKHNVRTFFPGAPNLATATKAFELWCKSADGKYLARLCLPNVVWRRFLTHYVADLTTDPVLGKFVLSAEAEIPIRDKLIRLATSKRDLDANLEARRQDAASMARNGYAASMTPTGRGGSGGLRTPGSSGARKTGGGHGQGFTSLHQASQPGAGTKRKQWDHRGGGSGGSYGPRGSTPPRGRGRGAPFRQPKY
jgi:hypothetical protein